MRSSTKFKLQFTICCSQLSTLFTAMHDLGLAPSGSLWCRVTTMKTYYRKNVTQCLKVKKEVTDHLLVSPITLRHCTHMSTL